MVEKQPPSHMLAVKREWIADVLVLLNEVAEDSSLAERLLAEAPGAVQDRLVAIKQVDLRDPNAFSDLNDGDI